MKRMILENQKAFALLMGLIAAFFILNQKAFALLMGLIAAFFILSCGSGSSFHDECERCPHDWTCEVAVDEHDNAIGVRCIERR